MSGMNRRMQSALAVRGLRYVRKDPDVRLLKLGDWAERIDRRGYYKNAYPALRAITGDPSNNWNRMIHSALREIDDSFQVKFIKNFLFNATMVWNDTKREIETREGCNIPWAILMDPTAGCNLRCVGCWAAEYKKSAAMDKTTLDGIIAQGKELGIHMYIYSGGEPLLRMDDILELAEKHDDCFFLSFTNATLVNERFARDSRRLGNIMLAISIEGFEKETDLRRGQGTYKKALAAMDILKANGVPFGFSACYHNLNTDVVGSDEFIDFMISKGCRFGWYFTYIPLGTDAKLDLLATPEQREFMYHKVREFRETKPIFVMDFWNDGEFVGGCIAGGRNYCHINAEGDMEPCAFIHYSNANIHNATLLETLKSPLFKEYAEGQPFNKNHLRPCPLLDNPEALRGMVLRSGAHSTQILDGEDVETLTGKCENISRAWAAKADSLWEAHS